MTYLLDLYRYELGKTTDAPDIPYVTEMLIFMISQKRLLIIQLEMSLMISTIVIRYIPSNCVDGD